MWTKTRPFCCRSVRMCGPGWQGTRDRCSRRCWHRAAQQLHQAALGDELEQVRKWPTILAGAPIAKLVAYKPQVEAIVNRCDDAIKAHESQAAILACGSRRSSRCLP